MRRLAALTLALAACLPAEDWPKADSDLAKSAFLAVEREDGKYEVYASKLVSGQPTFPTLLLDGERRVDVYFFGCSLEQLGPPAGRVMGEFDATDELPSVHPKPLRALTARVAGGRIEEWMESVAAVDLGLTHPCPGYRRAWRKLLGNVNPDFAWLLADESKLFVGSDAGSLYEIDFDGAVLSTTAISILDMTRIGDEYFGLVDLDPAIEVRRGPTPQTMSGRVGGNFGPTRRVRLRGRMNGSEPVLLAAQADHRLRYLQNGIWSPSELLICESRCRTRTSTSVFLLEMGPDWVAGATTLGCIGIGEESLDLPTQPTTGSESCRVVGGLDYQEQSGLVVSVGDELHCGDGETWKRLESVDSGLVIAETSGVVVVGSDHLTELFLEHPVCDFDMATGPRVSARCELSSNDFPMLSDGLDVIWAVRAAEGIVVLSGSTDEVWLSLLVRMEALNTCSG